MKRLLQLAPFALLLACGHTQNPEPQTAPAAEATAPATPEPAPATPPAPVAQPAPAAEPADPGMAAAQQDAAQQEAEWNKMEADAQQESARFTPELHAK